MKAPHVKTPKKRYTFKTIPPEHLDCEHWPAADVTFAKKEDEKRFQDMARGMRLYLSSGALRAAAREADCSTDSLLEALNRCVRVAADGRIVGWAGLIKGLRLNEYTRTRPLKEGRQTRGHAGLFKQFIEANNRKYGLKLEQLIDKGGSSGATSASPSLKDVVKGFRNYCFSQGMKPTDYPFNTASQGRRSIERFAKDYLALSPNAATVWFGEDAADKRNIGTGEKSFPFANAPFDVVGMDTHTMHCVGTLIVEGSHGPQEVAIERIDLHVLVDYNSTAVLGYAVSIASQISGLTIEKALLCLATPWKPRELGIEGVDYIPGAALPVGNIPGLDEIRPCAIWADNASAHFANRLTQTARMQLGCALTYIPVGAWWVNGITERVFRTLESWGFQKLPSSTGSNPADPLKPDSVRGALSHHITYEQLLDLVDAVMASYNASKSKGLGGQTPLQVLRSRLGGRNAPLFVRPSVPVTAHSPKLGITVEIRTVRGSQKTGRAPYVEIDQRRFSGPKLAKRYDLIEASIIVHIDEKDMRTVTAFERSGKELGVLTVLSKQWAATPHTREQAKVINRHIRNGELDPDGSDVVRAFMELLARNARKQIAARPKHVSGAATKLASASRDTGIAIGSLGPDADPGLPPIPHRPMPSRLAKPNWRIS